MFKDNSRKMELINRNAAESQPLVPKEKAPMALEEDFSTIFGSRKLNGDQFIGPAVRAASDSPNKMAVSSDKSNKTGPVSDKLKTGVVSDNLNTTAAASDKPGPRSPGDLGPLMDEPDPGTNDTDNNDFIMKEKNLPEKDDNVAITMPDADDTEGYHDGIPDYSDGRGSQVSGITNRFGETDNVDGATTLPHDDKVDAEKEQTDFNNVKHLTQGMMDVALLSANANQLRTVLESSNTHPYYVSSIVLISLSLICQVAVGITLIMDYQYHMTNQLQKAKTISRFSMFGIFLIIIINVFIAAFSVATPVVFTSAPAGVGTGTGTTT